MKKKQINTSFGQISITSEPTKAKKKLGLNDLKKQSPTEIPEIPKVNHEITDSLIDEGKLKIIKDKKQYNRTPISSLIGSPKINISLDDSIMGTFTIDDKQYSNIDAALADYPNQKHKDGIGMYQKPNSTISSLITFLVKNHREYIVKTLTTKSLSDLVNDEYNNIPISEIAYEYTSGVVATNTILKNYDKFMIWYAGLNFRKEKK